jgi:hypothetical protein
MQNNNPLIQILIIISIVNTIIISFGLIKIYDLLNQQPNEITVEVIEMEENPNGLSEDNSSYEFKLDNNSYNVI